MWQTTQTVWGVITRTEAFCLAWCLQVQSHTLSLSHAQASSLWNSSETFVKPVGKIKELNYYAASLLKTTLWLWIRNADRWKHTVSAKWHTERVELFSASSSTCNLCRTLAFHVSLCHVSPTSASVVIGQYCFCIWSKGAVLLSCVFCLKRNRL